MSQKRWLQVRWEPTPHILPLWAKVAIFLQVWMWLVMFICLSLSLCVCMYAGKCVCKYVFVLLAASLCRFPSRGMRDYVVSFCVSVCVHICVFLCHCVCACVCKYVCVLLSLCRFPSGGMRDHLHGSPSPNSLLLQFPPCNITTWQHYNITTWQHCNITTWQPMICPMPLSPPLHQATCCKNLCNVFFSLLTPRLVRAPLGCGWKSTFAYMHGTVDERKVNQAISRQARSWPVTRNHPLPRFALRWPVLQHRLSSATVGLQQLAVQEQPNKSVASFLHICFSLYWIGTFFRGYWITTDDEKGRHYMRLILVSWWNKQRPQFQYHLFSGLRIFGLTLTNAVGSPSKFWSDSKVSTEREERITKGNNRRNIRKSLRRLQPDRVFRGRGGGRGWRKGGVCVQGDNFHGAASQVANSCAIMLYFPLVWIWKIFWKRKSSIQRLLGN